MEYEQLSYWEGFSESTPWIFENLWYRVESDLNTARIEVEDCQTGHWFVKSSSDNRNIGIVVFSKDEQFGLNTLFIARLTPAGFIAKRQLLVAKDLKGTTSCRIMDLRNNWKYFEFEPWKSLYDPEVIPSLEFDISELPLSDMALESVTIKKVNAGEAGSVYQRWFSGSKR